MRKYLIHLHEEKWSFQTNFSKLRSGFKRNKILKFFIFLKRKMDQHLWNMKGNLLKSILFFIERLRGVSILPAGFFERKFEKMNFREIIFATFILKSLRKILWIFFFDPRNKAVKTLILRGFWWLWVSVQGLQIF